MRIHLTFGAYVHLDNAHCRAWWIFACSAPGRTKDVVERLLARGCKADGVDAQGNTPWHAAAESGNLEAVALFMSKGCKPDARNHAGWTALHFAARSGARPH